MYLEDRFFEQEWIQELTSDEFRVLIYLLYMASKKTGILELNMRKINFLANPAEPFTKEYILSRFSKMLRLLPERDNVAIFPDYIYMHWIKDETVIDTKRNPLFKSIVKELAMFNLTLDDVNAMSKFTIKRKQQDDNYEIDNTTKENTAEPVKNKTKQVADKAKIDVLFTQFWDEYPNTCPRKVDKKKCLEKFTKILNRSNAIDDTFTAIINGLKLWKESDIWAKDNGAYIRAPIVWLNNESWNDKPTKGGTNENKYTNAGKSSNTNYLSKENENLF